MDSTHIPNWLRWLSMVRAHVTIPVRARGMGAEVDFLFIVEKTE